MNASPLIPEEMRRQYVQRRKTDLAKLQDALENRDVQVFQRVGHQLKGNAATYGYLDLEAIGIRLEQIASLEATNVSEARGLLAEFAAWIHTADR